MIDNNEFYLLVSAGDQDARRRMIEGNMGLVSYKVVAYLREYPSLAHLREDLISEGYVGLVVAVNNMAKGGTPPRVSPAAYIGQLIQHTVGALVDTEAGTSETSRTRRSKRAEGAQMPAQIDADVTTTLDKILDPTSMVDLRDLIDSCCEGEEDRTLVRMREQGYSDKEIAAAIDAPVSATYMRRRELYARFLEKSGMKGEV